MANSWDYATIQHGFGSYEEMFTEVKRCYEKAAAEACADGIITSGAALLICSLSIKEM